MEIYLTWTNLKTHVTEPARLRYTESDNYYNIQLTDDDGYVFTTTITKDSGSDHTDFDTNYKGQANKPALKRDTRGYSILRQAAFTDTEGMRFRGTGITGTATAGATTNIDYALPEDRYINGMEMFLTNHVDGDNITFQVVDVNNILGLGAGAVLDEFATNWYVAADESRQGHYLLSYPALLYQGLYVRIRYTSVGGTNVTVRANLFLHKKPTA